MESVCASVERSSPDRDLSCGTEAGSYLRLIDSCITQIKAQGPSRTYNESKEEEASLSARASSAAAPIATCSAKKEGKQVKQLLHQPLSAAAPTATCSTRAGIQLQTRTVKQLLHQPLSVKPMLHQLLAVNPPRMQAHPPRCTLRNRCCRTIRPRPLPVQRAEAPELPWREAGPPNHHDDKVDWDQ